MENSYNHKITEEKLSEFWAKNVFFTPKIDRSKKPFSFFLVPPNASGPMHVGNALMIAIEDILARHFRSKGHPTLWIPLTDHGGYETEITFEKELERIGKKKSDFKRNELFNKISDFVDQNNILIKDQIKKLGASVDWTRFKYNMDQSCVEEIGRIFKKMTDDNLISRRPHMIQYCPTCATVLSDIELKERHEQKNIYFVKFYFSDSNDYLTLTTTKPEFLFSVTHVLIHPEDRKNSHLIGKKLKNPMTNDVVDIIASKRKFDPKEHNKNISPFGQSYIKYDYEYALMSNIPIPARNLIDWNGNMTERYPGIKPLEAREKEVIFLKEKDLIEKIENVDNEPELFCKKGHRIESVIMMTWSLDLDKNERSLKKEALNAIEKESMLVLPQWRKQELVKWIKVMKHWPIARQNVWGIKIPVWYDISDPSNFFVWFIDKKGIRNSGNLKTILETGFELQEISDGLERIYTSDSQTWTLHKQPDKTYLPETDVFDTWFSGQWATMIFGDINSPEFSYFYPSDCLVIGYDLVRLSVARKIILNYYLTNKLPYKTIYFNGLIQGSDGQKMSKSLGNVVSLEHYLEKFGADVTRMSLISNTGSQEDFKLSEQTLLYFQDFNNRLWRMGKVVDIANQYLTGNPKIEKIDEQSALLMSSIKELAYFSDTQIERFMFSSAQDKVTDFLLQLEEYTNFIQQKDKKEEHLVIFRDVFKKYLSILHPFAPFVTEELNINLFNNK